MKSQSISFQDPFALTVVGVTLCLLYGLYIFRRPLFRWLSGADADLRKIQGQKKSSEVRTGKIVETLAPLTDLFPVDITKPKTSTMFLGQPIDYVHFDPDEGVTFIEVKSGNSQLSSDQKKIKAAIESGKVYWAEVRIK